MSTKSFRKNQPVGNPNEFGESDFLSLLTEIPGMPRAATRLIEGRLDALDAELSRRLEILAAQDAEFRAFESFSQFGAPNDGADARFTVVNDGMPF